MPEHSLLSIQLPRESIQLPLGFAGIVFLFATSLGQLNSVMQSHCMECEEDAHCNLEVRMAFRMIKLD